MRASALERRWIARVRSRAALLGLAGVGGVAVAAVFAVALPVEERAAAIAQAVASAGALVVPILTHGMISAELRSGAAMLWLQKPVRPVVFYALRGVEVTALAVALVLALWAAGSALIAASVGLDVARDLVESAPGALLLLLSICVLTFAFSAWSVPTDSLFAVLFLVVGTFWMARGGPLVSALEWVAVPIDPIMELVANRSAIPRAEVIWRVGRFLLLWGLLGTLGLAVTTRSPLPRETAR